MSARWFHHFTTCRYATLLRSHTKTVHAVAVDSASGHLCTAAADGSIRIWDATTYQQLLEFLVPGEVCHSCQYHPSLPLVACGFGGGLVRIFNVAETRMVHEHKQHKGAVRQVTGADLFANRNVWDSPRPPITLSGIVARTEGYTHDAEVWDLPIVQGPVSAAPCQSLKFRFANVCIAERSSLSVSKKAVQGSHCLPVSSPGALHPGRLEALHGGRRGQPVRFEYVCSCVA